MNPPFTVEQFFDVFRRYNEALWPFQVALVIAGIVAAALVFVRRPWSGACISAILAFLWAWLGLAYHIGYFARINPAAYAFGAMSILGAAAFLWQGVVRRRLRYSASTGARSWVAGALVAFALAGYPLWGSLAGHRYPAIATFGLPCPTTIFTLGILGFLAPPFPRSPFAVPLLWCAVGAQAAIFLDVAQDLSLVAAAVAGIAFAFVRARPAS